MSDFQRIQHFDSEGRFLGALAQTIYGGADGLTVTASGHVYMCDRDLHRVEAFDGAGTNLFWWGVDAEGGWHIPNALEDAGGVSTSPMKITEYRTDRLDLICEFGELWFMSDWAGKGLGFHNATAKAGQMVGMKYALHQWTQSTCNRNR